MQFITPTKDECDFLLIIFKNNKHEKKHNNKCVYVKRLHDLLHFNF